MQIRIDANSSGPIYQQIVNQISRDIALNALGPGYQLPTVRRLAAESGISPGTIKHAYDILERAGLIIKNRGSGTFVALPQESDRKGTKAQAMQAIDETLTRLKELSFSPNEIRIFFELKLREWEDEPPSVTVAAVDCSPEALSVMHRQIADMPRAEAFKFLLEDVLNAPNRFDPGTDVVVTTPTHYDDLIKKMIPGQQPFRLVMAVATGTALELAALPADAEVGVISASQRFAQIMLGACEKYGKLKSPVALAFFGDTARISELMQKCGHILLPPNYQFFATDEETALIAAWEQTNHAIHYGYQVERGSLLFLEEQIAKLFKDTHLRKKKFNF
ncbi:MAG: GntR family transcriptional regulator [Spirochaetaceae bacterium]|jgi:DNA-binding transcriptional regulator YhcF (GntR family)|nr:GntR family transcriptional regulator [Spirochaetaceae bacterium]